MNAPLPPSVLPPIWTTGSTEVFKTGTWRAAVPHHIHAPSPCHRACPVGGDIAEWIGLARGGDFQAAWQVLTRHNPFPAIAGRICHHPCESACNRAGFDASVSICALERFVGDEAIAQAWPFAPPAQERAGHVAVLGGGPAGLSAAFHLRRLGWRVTIFEAGAELGGVMRHGIPSYRLAREVLDAEIDRIMALGVTLHRCAALTTPEQFENLERGYDAVFVAVGAARPKRLPVLDYTAPWVMDGAAYLAASNAGRPPTLGPAVVVIGGGSAALDCARSARRAGHEVTILALESRAQMPAQREEVEEAIEEGIAIIDGARLQRAEPTAQGLRVVCSRVRFVAGAERGQFSIEPTGEGDFSFVADVILSSIGQDPDLSMFGDDGAAKGSLLAADRQGATERDGVWAGGDVTSLARFVTEAVGMGQRAALAIHARLLREAPRDDGVAQATVPLDAIATWYHPRVPRQAAPRRLPSERQASTAEVQLGFSAAQALAESERCFSCGTCVDCDNCIVVCPDLAVRRVGGQGRGIGNGKGYEVLADYCKGCGLCVRECPTGSMTMVEERR